MSHPNFLPVAGGYSPGVSTARPPRGSLLFDCDFECGNLDYVERMDDIEYELRIRGDTLAEKHSIWFYFRVVNVRKGQRVLFHLNNYSKKKALFGQGMTCMVRSTSRPGWERMPVNSHFYYRCPRHAPKFCLTISFLFDREFTAASAGSPQREEEYFFAYSFPYTYADLQRYLTMLDSQHAASGIYRRDCLARTLLGRRLDLLCISSEENVRSRSKDAAVIAATASQLAANTHGSQSASAMAAASIAAAAASSSSNSGVLLQSSASTPRRHCILFTARVHPGETPASYVCQGIIDFLLSGDPAARLLRQHVIFYFVPMLNPDGVALGNYRCNSLGFDLNRHWHSPQPQLHPTLVATKSFLLYLGSEHQHGALRLDYFIDIHGHTSGMNSFMFLNQEGQQGGGGGTGVSTPGSADLPRLLDAHSEHFSLSSSKSLPSDLAGKEGTGRRAMAEFLSDAGTACYTLEVSFFCSNKGGKRSAPYTQSTYLDIGRSIAATLALAFRLGQQGATAISMGIAVPRPIAAAGASQSSPSSTPSSSTGPSPSPSPPPHSNHTVLSVSAMALSVPSRPSGVTLKLSSQRIGGSSSSSASSSTSSLLGGLQSRRRSGTYSALIAANETNANTAGNGNAKSSASSTSLSFLSRNGPRLAAALRAMPSPAALRTGASTSGAGTSSLTTASNPYLAQPLGRPRLNLR